MVQNMRLRPRLAQAEAYPGRGVLGCPHPVRGLSWTWKCSYKWTQTLSAACWSRQRLLRMRVFTPKRGITTNYVIIGPIWLRTKPWAIYTSSSRLFCKPYSYKQFLSRLFSYKRPDVEHEHQRPNSLDLSTYKKRSCIKFHFILYSAVNTNSSL